MGDIHRGVFSRFLKTFLLLALTVALVTFITGVISEFNTPTDHGISVRVSAFNADHGLPAFVNAILSTAAVAGYRALFSLFTAFPFLLLISLYYAYFYISDRSLRGVFASDILIFRISQNLIAAVTVLIVAYILFSYILVGTLSEMAKSSKMMTIQHNYRRYNSWIINDNIAQARKHLRELERIMDTGNSVLPGSFTPALEHLAVAIEQDALNYDALELRAKAYDLNEVNEQRLSPQSSAVISYLRLGTQALAGGRLKEATIHFEKVLSLYPNNEEAVYRLKEIQSIQSNAKFIYENKSHAEINLIVTLTNAAKALEGGDHWKSYMLLTNLIVRHPFHNDLRKYYALTMKSIQENDFCIIDARHVVSYIIQHDSLSAYNQSLITNRFRKLGIRTINGIDVQAPEFAAAITNLHRMNINDINGVAKNDKDFPRHNEVVKLLIREIEESAFITGDNVFPSHSVLRLSDGRLLYFGAIIPFDGNQYLSDVTITSEDGSRVQYAFGRILNAELTNAAGAVTGVTKFVLKGRMRNGTPSADDTEKTDVYIRVNPSVLDNLNAPREELELLSVPALYTMYKDYPKIGYAVDDVRQVLGKRLMLPLWLIALVFIIAYLSLRYRLSYQANLHPLHSLTGFAGVALLTVLGLTVFDFLFAFLYRNYQAEIAYSIVAGGILVITAWFSIAISRYRFSA